MARLEMQTTGAIMTSATDSFIRRFLKQEAAGGILLVLFAVLAIAAANSPLYALYRRLLEMPLEVQVGSLEIAKPLLLWVNDGLMAIFFLLVGLELKREFLQGELSSRKKVVLPGLGALGGMLMPAAIYIIFNARDPIALQGWAIPAATDIAFALGVLALLGSRVPAGLKIFLTSLAIFDDIGAIIIIAFFYTSKISFAALIVTGACLLVLFVLNRRGIAQKSIYLTIGVIMWIALLKSGVHATLAGILLAIFIPIKSTAPSESSPLQSLEHDLHGAVAFIILPLFAFCNSGIRFSGMGWEQVAHPIPLGIALGLFFGKQLGVFVFCWLGIKWGVAELPTRATWLSFYGTAVLCGIGFTMSLFIGSLAFEETGANLLIDERLGILAGSLASGLYGYWILRLATKPAAPSS